MSVVSNGQDGSAAPTHDPSKRTWFWKAAQAFCRIITTLMFDYKAYGVHNVPMRGGVLLVSNHQSYLDPVLLGVPLRRPMSYLAKSELFANKFFGALIRALNAFPVRQGAADVGAVKETIKRLQEGYLLNIFPEGTRSEDGLIGKIESGAALVVRRANVPVVPVVIDGSFDAWPRHAKVFHSHPIRVMYGPPMDVANMKAAEITRVIDRTLRKMFDELRAKDHHREA
jgi:1-acyl-sn-glycerol-3-phosphate acyltransferase